MQINSCWRLILVFICIALACSLAIYVCNFDIYLKLLVWSLVMLNIVYFILDHACKLLPKSICYIFYVGNREWVIRFKNDVEMKVSLGNDSIITSKIMVLNFITTTSSRYVVLITPGSVGKGDYHKLQVAQTFA